MSLLPVIYGPDRKPTCVVVADLRKWALIGTLVGNGMSAETGEVDLRISELPFDQERFRELERECAAKLSYNENTLAPRAIVRSGRSLVLVLERSKYSAFQAAAKLMAEIPEERRTFSMVRSGLGVPADFSHSLGVNVTLVTADNMLVSTMRRTAGNPLLSVAMSEGATVMDLPGYDWSPLSTALRGFKEELNMVENDFIGTSGRVEVDFHSLITQVSDGGVSVIGHARTTLTSAEVLERRSGAVDGWESEEIILTPMTAEAIENLVTGSISTDWLPIALRGALRIETGDEEVEVSWASSQLASAA